MNEFTITLTGYIAGVTWQGCKATMPFTQKYSLDPNRPFRKHWTGLKDAVVSITSCGDFQTCDLLCLDMIVEKYVNEQNASRFRRVRSTIGATGTGLTSAVTPTSTPTVRTTFCRNCSTTPTRFPAG